MRLGVDQLPRTFELREKRGSTLLGGIDEKQSELRASEKTIADLRIKLSPSLSDKLLTYLFRRHRSPVGAVGRHGVNGIREHDYAGPEWNLVAREPIRIA